FALVVEGHPALDVQADLGLVHLTLAATKAKLRRRRLFGLRPGVRAAAHDLAFDGVASAHAEQLAAAAPAPGAARPLPDAAVQITRPELAAARRAVAARQHARRAPGQA